MKNNRLATLAKWIKDDVDLIIRNIDLLPDGEDFGDVVDELEMAHRHITTADNYLEDAFGEINA
jgi:hypothetical protein